MIEKEFCNHEQSFLLEKLGFDGDCIGFYERSHLITLGNFKTISINNKTEFLDMWEPDVNSITCAPLLQQAYRFFTNLGYYSTIKKICESKWNFTIEKDSIITSGEFYETQTECSENCLNQLISLHMESFKNTEDKNTIIQEIKDFLKENSLFTFEAHDDLIIEFLKTVN